MSFSCARNFLHRFCVDEFHRSTDSSGGFFSSDLLLPSLGARINQATKLRRCIISPFSPRYRWWLLTLLPYKHFFREKTNFLILCSSFQGLGDVLDSSGHLLGLDLPVWVCISDLQTRRAFRDWQHCQWLLRNWYRPHLLCGISWQPILSSYWWSQENCNQVHKQHLTINTLCLNW